MPDAMAPELTIRYSCRETSIWSTRARMRALSIRPLGAMRLVPTLITRRTNLDSSAKVDERVDAIVRHDSEASQFRWHAYFRWLLQIRCRVIKGFHSTSNVGIL